MLIENEGRRALLAATVADLMRVGTSMPEVRAPAKMERKAGKVAGWRSSESRAGGKAEFRVDSRSGSRVGCEGMEEEDDDDGEVESLASETAKKSSVKKARGTLGRFMGKMREG